MKIDPKVLEKDVQGYCPCDEGCPCDCKHDCYDKVLQRCTPRTNGWF